MIIKATQKFKIQVSKFIEEFYKDREIETYSLATILNASIPCTQKVIEYLLEANKIQRVSKDIYRVI